MKIAILSDIHENFHNLILALEEIGKKEVEQIICLGDLMNSGIAKLLATQTIPVFMIWGNNDGEKVEITLASKRANSVLTVSKNVYDFLVIDNKKIFLSHYEDLAMPMAKSGEYDAVFYGIELKGSVSLKTPLMEAYFKKHGPKMGLRSKKAMGLMNVQESIIPANSPIYQALEKAANTAKVVVFSGLPGVGKSLYINQFQLIAETKGKKVSVIQWDT